MPGYEVKFVNVLLKRHECPICLFAMKTPVQTECGHLFCKECLEPVLKRKRPICPIDKEEIHPDSIFPDNACRREILNLDVYCKFAGSGCEWVGPLKNLEVCNTSLTCTLSSSFMYTHTVSCRPMYSITQVMCTHLAIVCKNASKHLSIVIRIATFVSTSHVMRINCCTHTGTPTSM